MGYKTAIFEGLTARHTLQAFNELGQGGPCNKFPPLTTTIVGSPAPAKITLSAGGGNFGGSLAVGVPDDLEEEEEQDEGPHLEIVVMEDTKQNVLRVW